MSDISNQRLFLYDCISHLNEYSCNVGGEGKAYFVNDDYVVKKYTHKNDEQFHHIFSDYCREMKSFAEKGFNVPKIYAWDFMPNVDRKARPECRFDYYILEERIKGRQIFQGNIETIYSICKDLCDRAEFKQTVQIPELNRSLFKKILTRYVEDFQEVNNYLCSMPESQIDKFLFDLYLMCLDGKFSNPDIFATNVLTNDKGFFVIDNEAKRRVGTELASKRYSDRIFTTGLLWIFAFNNYVTNGDRFGYFDDEYKSFLLDQRDKVVKPCKEAMIRFIKRAKYVCFDVKLSEFGKSMGNHYMLKKMLDEESANEIFDCLEK